MRYGLGRCRCHSLVKYRLPTTGEVVPLLQIVRSKTDAERLLVVSPRDFGSDEPAITISIAQ
jgi:hypothetical protein